GFLWTHFHVLFVELLKNLFTIPSKVCRWWDLPRIILDPGDTNRDVSVTETFHEQTDDELSEKELNQIEADDQAIQTILLGLPEDIYAAVDSCETAQEIWLQV
nr:hypothetical protein [Tanacetum cinerariifolium]